MKFGALPGLAFVLVALLTTGACIPDAATSLAYAYDGVPGEAPSGLGASHFRTSYQQQQSSGARSGHRGLRYDEAANLVRANARSDGYRLAPQAAGTSAVDATSAVSKAGRRPTAAVRQAADEAATDADGVLRCQACGDALTPTSGAPNSREFDHIWPFSRGGGRDIDNIWDLCRTCNRQKGVRTLEEWGWPW